MSEEKQSIHRMEKVKMIDTTVKCIEINYKNTKTKWDEI